MESYNRIIYYIANNPNPKILVIEENLEEKLNTIKISEMKKSSLNRQLYYYQQKQSKEKQVKFLIKEEQFISPNKQQCDKENYAHNKTFEEIFKIDTSFILKDQGKYIIYDGKIHKYIRKNPILEQLIVVTDLDGTLVHNEDAKYNTEFKNFWIENYLLEENVTLIYSTGRSKYLYLKLLKLNNLIIPDYLITGLGTHIYDCHEDHHVDIHHENSYKHHQLWEENLLKNFNCQILIQSFLETGLFKQDPRDKSDDMSIRLIALKQEQNQQLQSEFLEKLKTEMQKQNIFYEISTFETPNTEKGHYNMHIRPRVNQGNSLEFLLEHILKNKDLRHKTVSFGDSFIDLDMLKYTKDSVIVANYDKTMTDFVNNQSHLHPNIKISKGRCSQAIIHYLSEIYQDKN